MLTGDNITTRNIHGISDENLKNMQKFLKGLVYSWCNTKEEEWFAARDLIGGNNKIWNDNDLQELYDRYINQGKSPDKAKTQAAKDAGHLLKKVLEKDPRKFETKKGYPSREYRWIK